MQVCVSVNGAWLKSNMVIVSRRSCDGGSKYYTRFLQFTFVFFNTCTLREEKYKDTCKLY